MAYIKDKDQKILWGRSAAMCNICRAKLIFECDQGDHANVGAMCHIVGEKKGSARYHSTLSDDDKNSYSNLILLCSHHHDIIDKDESKYSIESLHKIKGMGGRPTQLTVYSFQSKCPTTLLHQTSW